MLSEYKTKCSNWSPPWNVFIQVTFSLKAFVVEKQKNEFQLYRKYLKPDLSFYFTTENSKKQIHQKGSLLQNMVFYFVGYGGRGVKHLFPLMSAAY